MAAIPSPWSPLTCVDPATYPPMLPSKPDSGPDPHKASPIIEQTHLNAPEEQKPSKCVQRRIQSYLVRLWFPWCFPQLSSELSWRQRKIRSHSPDGTLVSKE